MNLLLKLLCLAELGISLFLLQGCMDLTNNVKKNQYQVLQEQIQYLIQVLVAQAHRLNTLPDLIQ